MFILNICIILLVFIILYHKILIKSRVLYKNKNGASDSFEIAMPFFILYFGLIFWCSADNFYNHEYDFWIIA